MVTNAPAHTVRPMPAANNRGPILDERTRLRLGRQLQALYDPVFDEALDPRLTALIQKLENDKSDVARC